MDDSAERDSHVHYVQIDESRCTGCVLCMKACPTKAIRVKDGRVAKAQGVCIDCGECVRVCPQGAVKALSTEKLALDEKSINVVSASTVIYSQFGEGVLPNDILLAIKRMGFDYVHDQSYTNEMFNVAIELYIKEARKSPDSPWPLISPVCPVVTRLIDHRFPSLLKHIPPLVTPREIVAREAKRRLSGKYGCKQDDIRVVHITPCPAKMICIKEPFVQTRSFLDSAIGISHVYASVRKNLGEITEDEVLHHSSGVGLGWGMWGGEIAGLDMACLAVSGLQETIRYLEKIEMGLLRDMDYVEFRICTEGCLGGPYTVADKYLAKHHLQRLVRMFGVEKRVKYEYVRDLYRQGWFFTDKKLVLPESRTSSESISRRIERELKVEKIMERLPQKQCGLCGSPDCATFAEDVVDGRASLKDCVFMKQTVKKKATRGGVK